MKKKTVITTEKREVWVIHQSGETKEQGSANNESEPVTDSVVALLDQANETDDSHDEHQD